MSKFIYYFLFVVISMSQSPRNQIMAQRMSEERFSAFISRSGHVLKPDSLYTLVRNFRNVVWFVLHRNISKNDLEEKMVSDIMNSRHFQDIDATKIQDEERKLRSKTVRELLLLLIMPEGIVRQGEKGIHSLTRMFGKISYNFKREKPPHLPEALFDDMRTASGKIEYILQYFKNTGQTDFFCDTPPDFSYLPGDSSSSSGFTLTLYHFEEILDNRHDAEFMRALHLLLRSQSINLYTSFQKLSRAERKRLQDAFESTKNCQECWKEDCEEPCKENRCDIGLEEFYAMISRYEPAESSSEEESAESSLEQEFAESNAEESLGNTILPENEIHEPEDVLPQTDDEYTPPDLMVLLKRLKDM